MTKKDLVRVIRKVVREEVQMALKKELTEVFKSLKSKPITETKRRVVKKRKPQQKLVDDPVLNQILNETRGGIPQGEGHEEYPTMGGGVFDSSRAAELLGYGEAGFGNDKETARKVAAVQTMKEAGVSSADVPESVVDALTKDYSALMKHDKMKSKR